MSIHSVVISQPMFFPWIGMFEQIRLADVYVHYDDVQFSKGSFTNRVQIKTPGGWKWLTVPLQNHRLGQAISEVELSVKNDWRRSHMDSLHAAYFTAPFYREMIQLVEEVYSEPYATICELSKASMEAVARYFELHINTTIAVSSQLYIYGSSSERVLSIVKHFGGTHYITGHGAKKYLDHELFERNGIRVEYMNYQKTPYPQLHGAFNPYVSILDLIANCGRAGIQFIHSTTQYWREVIHEPRANSPVF